MVKKTLLGIIMFFCFFWTFYSYASASTYTVKKFLVYEINEVAVQNNSFLLTGWAFINAVQHYRSQEDIEGQLLVKSTKEVLQYQLQFHALSMTDLMKMEGRRRCQDTEYNQPASICYYDYDMVSFQVKIPFSELKDNSKYTLILQIKAKKISQSYMIDAFFISSKDRIAAHNGRTIKLSANLNQSQFYVNHDFVLARKTASKNSAVHQAATSCSSTYGSQYYFEPLSQYYHVKEATVKERVTWYQVLAEAAHCSANGKFYIKEGQGNPTWIPSTFIEYNGTPATIEVFKLNTPPELILSNPTIYVGDTSFNPDHYVSARDAEDGELVPKRGMGNWTIHKAGTYLQEYSAIDSGGLHTSKIMMIYVKEKPPNTPPKIHAGNRTIHQYQNFDPLLGVRAEDLEDGDITNRLQITKQIDPSKVGSQDLCFYVEDSLGLPATKCVIIDVLAVPENSGFSQLRFVDQINLFYKESIPSIWRGNVTRIQKAIKTKNAIQSSILR